MKSKKHISLLIAFVIYSLVCNISFAQTVINPIAGNHTIGYTGDGGQATAAELDDPNGVAVDKAGNFYIADADNNVIRKVNAAGIITTIVGTGYNAGTGSGGFSPKQDGVPGTTVRLNNPEGVAVDTLGNVYFCDTGNNLVRKLLTTGIIVTIAGLDTSGTSLSGTGGYGGDGGPATLAYLSGPGYVAVDLQGNVYISDGNNLVRKVNTAGIISTVAGDTTGVSTHSNSGYSGDGGQATAAKLATPQGLAVDNAGNLYIADGGNNVVRKVNTAGIISTIAGNVSNSGYSGDGGAATAAAFQNTSDVAVDNAGNIYIADNSDNVIRKVNTLGIISTVAGNGFGWDATMPPLGGYSGDGGYATNAELWQPNAVAVDATGSIYISDEHNNVIRKVTAGSPTAGISTFNTQHTTFQIYPNPTSGMLNVEFLMLNETIGICDVLGNTLIQHSAFNTQHCAIDVSALQSGVYFIKTTQGTQKFIKQ